MNAVATSDGAFYYNEAVKVETAQRAYRDYWLRPIGGVVNQEGPHTFIIDGTADQYLQLNNARLEMKLKVMRADGGNLRSAIDIVAPMNLLGPCMWKSIEVRVNDHPFNGASQMNMGHKCFVETMLTYDTDSANTHLNVQGFMLDSPQQFDNMKIGMETLKRYAIREITRGNFTPPVIDDAFKPKQGLEMMDPLGVDTYDEVMYFAASMGVEVTDADIAEELRKQVERKKLYAAKFTELYKNQAQKMAATKSHAYNLGYDARYTWTEGSASFDMMSPIPHDFFKLDNHVGPNNKIEIRLSMYPHAFLLNSPMADQNYKIVIEDMKLHLHSITLAENIARPMVERYRMNETQMHKWVVPRNVPSYSFRIHNGGVMPKNIIISMTSTVAAEGQYNFNPWNLQHFDIQKMQLNINGERFPSSGGLEFDFSTPNALVSRGYHWMFANTGSTDSDRGNLVSWAAFKDGCFIVPFDLTPDRCNRQHDHQPEVGFIDLELEFRASLPEPIYVFYELVFPKLVVNNHNQNTLEFFDIEVRR